jgi:hypothetical protein
MQYGRAFQAILPLIINVNILMWTAETLICIEFQGLLAAGFTRRGFWRI